ncbi:MAG: toll/interleukin-1 receptor domain-containing protein, partial [Myxococcota bacterium]
MSTVFVSYAHASAVSHELIEALTERLEPHGIRLLFDTRIEPGEAWRDELATWLDGCQGAVVLLTPEALQSRWVKLEVELLALRKRARKDRFVFVPWRLGVKWSELDSDAFAVGLLTELQAVSGVDAIDEVAAQLEKLPREGVYVGAPEDRHRVAVEVGRQEELTGAVLRPLSLDCGFDDAARVALQSADQVRFFWSVAARRDPHVQDALAFVEALDETRRETGDGPPPGWLLGHALDRVELPAVLDSAPGRPPWPVWLGLLLGLGLFGAALVVQPPELSIGSYVALGAAALLGTGIWGLFALRRNDRLLRAGRVHAAGDWLNRAKVVELLGAAEGFLDGIYGPRLVSWRSVGISAALTAVTIVPLAIIFAFDFTESGATESMAMAAAGSLVVTLPLAFGNIFFDFFSLVFTRTILRGLVRGGGGVRLLLGLGLDFVLVGLCALLTVFFGFTLHGEGGLAKWPLWVIQTAGRAFTGGIDLAAASGDFLTATLLISAVAMLTAVFPSLVHGTLLAVGLGNRALGRLPLRTIGEALKRWGDSRHGPWELVLPLAVLALAGAAAWDVVPDAPVPEPFDVPTAEWRRIDTSVCGASCPLGCDRKVEPDCTEDEKERYVTPPPPFDLLRSEVTQELWRSVWTLGGRIDEDRFGLPENPSVFVRPRHPVDSVSWCDAVRFANLWSRIEGRAPAYHGVGDPTDHAVRTCEASGAALA